MTCKSCQERIKEIRLLNQQITILREQNQKLNRKLKELLQHPSMLAGIKGERLILEFTKGKTTKKCAPYDIRTQDGKRIEVKYSNISCPVLKSTTKRWVWCGLFGERDAKDYDFLVLIGDKDGEHHIFEEDNSNFVYFILTKDNIKEIATTKQKRGWIALNINPKTGWSRAKMLWKYKVSADEAKKFFDQSIIGS